MTASARKNPKDAGDRAESNVIGLVDELEPVGDGTAYWHDARTSTMLSWQPGLPVVGCAVIPPGTAVEIKSTMVCYGQRSDNGRFYLPRKQHDRLLEAGGVYCFAVCEPTPDREVLALKVIPADHVAALVPGWIDVDDDRPEGGYAQMTWSRLFDEQEVTGRV